MTIEQTVRSWHGRVYRHLPATSPFDPLDTRFARRSRENHWNRPGEPTLYCATDRAMLHAVFQRHFSRDRSPELTAFVQTRRVFEIELTLDRVYDLTNPDALARLGIVDTPNRFRDRTIARATAGFLRDVIEVEAIIAPDITEFHRPGYRMVILFLDRLNRPLSETVQRITPAGRLQTSSSAMD